MASIERFFDEDFAVDFLGRVPELGISRSGIVECEVVPLKVKEGKKRGVLLFNLSVRDSRSPPAPTTLLPIVGKFRRSAKDKETFRIMSQLWEKGFGEQSPLRIPRPVAYVEDSHLLLSSRANGLTLEQMLEVVSRFVHCSSSSMAGPASSDSCGFPEDAHSSG